MNKDIEAGMFRKSKSKSRPSDYILSKSRITRAKDKKISNIVKNQDATESELCKELDSDDQPIPQKSMNNSKDPINLVNHYEENFLRNPKFSFVTMKIREAPDKNKLMKIYRLVIEMGGFKAVTANLAWDEVAKKLSLGNNENVFEIYKKYLFHYEKAFNPETALKLNLKDDGVCLEDLDPNYLIPVKAYHVSKPSDITPEIIREVLNQDISVIRNFEKASRFHKEMFTPEALVKSYPNDPIDIVTQDPDVKTFHRTKHEKQRWKISDYVKYQKRENIRDEDGMIKFGVNLDIGHWNEHMDELVAKIPEEFMCCSLKDSLQYVRQHILGMTLPQMYLKVKGAWTGGHEENLRYRAVNLNHGPASSEWNAVGINNCSKLREEVRDVYKTDIYKKEGLWFADVDFCIGKQIPIVCFNQREGDLVILGPGCEHWVRSFGKASQTAWNFGTMEKWQIGESIRRMDINSKINFKSIVPNWTLMMDLVNHEITKLDSDSCRLIYKELKRKWENDKNDRDELIRLYCTGRKLNHSLFHMEPNDSNVLQCYVCGIDTFNYWISEDKRSSINFTCLTCSIN